MKLWQNTRHHQIICAHGLTLDLSSLPKTREPGEPKLDCETHHYRLSETHLAPTPEKLVEKIQRELENANKNWSDAPFGPVTIGTATRGRKKQQYLVVKRPWRAVSSTPFKTNEPPKEWGACDVHIALANRELYFQRAYTQGRFNVYEYHMNTEEELDKDPAYLREIIVERIREHANEARGTVTVQMHPLSKTEPTYKHALVVQIKTPIRPKLKPPQTEHPD